jgi:hypothetical protein
VLLIVGAVLIALAMHWPLPLHLDRDVPKNLGDPLAQAWQVAWIGHALTHQPLDLFQANIYWPLQNTLAFTDALIGYAPVGMLEEGPRGALVGYNLLFLFAYALAFIGAYLLTRELGMGTASAAVGGAAFAYAPWRLGQDGHLNILSSGGIPLSIFLLLRGYRRESPGTMLAGWLVATWQLLLGIGLGLQLAYLLLVLGVLAAVYAYRRRLPLRRGTIAATAAGIVVLLLTTAFLARPYLEVRDDYPESTRTLVDVEAYSPDIGGFLRVPAGNLIRGTAGRELGEPLPKSEHTLFPGAVILMLAIVGAVAPVYPLRRRVVMVIAVLGLATLSLGYDADRSLPMQPYKFVHEYLPGWNAIRVPSRINTVTSLGLALLASAGVEQLVRSARSRLSHLNLRPPALTSGASALLVAAILLEGSGFQVREGGITAPSHPAVPSVPIGQLGQPGPQIHLPYADRYPFGDVYLYVYWSTDRFPETVNGWGGFVPTSDVQFDQISLDFPDSTSVQMLRSRGIRTVILHPDLAAGTPWANAAVRSVRGLPLMREYRGGVVIYHLKPT